MKKKPDYRTMSCEEIREFAQIETVKKRLGAPYVDIYQKLANYAARNVGRARATTITFGNVTEPTVLNHRSGIYVDRMNRNPPSMKRPHYYWRYRYELAVCEVQLPQEWNIQQPIEERETVLPQNTYRHGDRSTAPPCG